MRRPTVMAFALLASPLALSIHGCVAEKRSAGLKGGLPTSLPAIPSTQQSATVAQPPAMERPLFDRLGGTAGVTKVVDDFVTIAAADANVNFTRNGHPTAWDPTPDNVAHLKKRLVDFIATTTGGDVNYEGKDMVSAHKGMGITDEEFDAIAADLKQALDKQNIAAPAQLELLAVVNKTRAAIVEVRDEPAVPASEAPEPGPGGTRSEMPVRPADGPPKNPALPSVAPQPAAATAEPVKPFTPGASSDETELETSADAGEAVKGAKPTSGESNR